MSKTYLVGGAVRDKLLGVTTQDRDWVVVGSTPADMERAGYKAVGKDFPVFLHPETNEEYALARTERKTGHGYGGFSFHTDAGVTLEEDLRRRDLTINAMAESDNGDIIDPYGGQQDLDKKRLRHVSPAFAEDPLRILRVARFAARYHHLGFRVADETQALMQTVVDSGEVAHLVAERVWRELERALGELNPQVFIEVLKDCGALAVILPELAALFGVPQRADHHPEIDCGVHTLMVLEQAAKLSNSTRVRFASLAHDLGKAETPSDVLPQHIAHEVRSEKLVDALCHRLTVPKAHKELALAVARDHTNAHRALELKASTLLKLLQRLDAFRRPKKLEEFILCCEADARGRKGFEDRAYPQANYLRQAQQQCSEISTQDIIAAGHTGKAIGDELQKSRIKTLQLLKDTFSNAPNKE